MVEIHVICYLGDNLAEVARNETYHSNNKVNDHKFLNCRKLHREDIAMERKFSYTDMVDQKNLITPKVQINEVETKVLDNLMSFNVMTKELYDQSYHCIVHIVL